METLHHSQPAGASSQENKIDTKNTENTIFHLQDVFNIYLESDIAGDNDDRRAKLNAFTQTFELLKNSKLNT